MCCAFEGAGDGAALREGATKMCYNLGDLASNLDVGRPLARVTGWVKKVP